MTEWDDQALRARIRREGKERYAAGSPDHNEIEVYRTLLARTLAGDGRRKQVLVLGMTPELRRITASLGCRTLCIDINPRSIDLFRDWLTAKQRRNETIIQGDWLQLPRLLNGPVDAILGDGLFGNLHTIEDHRLLLSNMIQCLAPGAAVIQRNIFIPRQFNPRAHAAAALLRAFRAGEIGGEEFGFGMRIWGRFGEAYDADTLLLDNRQVYDTYRSWRDSGRLSVDEYDLIQRYYFAGRNLIPDEELWEFLLTEAGFSYERQRIAGQQWYGYYPIYYCQRR